jgi:hypothetical protein
MWHELGHAFANVAAGRKSGIQIAPNGFGRAIFDLRHKLDCLDEVFVAASGTAAQLIYLERNGNELFRLCPEHERFAFYSVFVQFANELDRKKFKNICSGTDISPQNFFRFAERLAHRMKRLPAVLEVLAEMSKVPANLPPDQVETNAGAAELCQALAELRKYARRSVRGLSHPR